MARSADFIHTVTEYGKLAFADREAWYATPISPMCRQGALSASTRRAAAGLAGPRRRPSCGQVPRGRVPRLPDFVTRAFRRRRRRRERLARHGREPPAPRLDPGTGEPTMRTSGPDPGPDGRVQLPGRRHLPSGRGRPVGTWCPPPRAAAGCSPRRSSRPRLLPRHPGADFTSPPGCPLPSRRQAAAHHADPEPGLRDREPYMAFGTPGGDQQDQWSLAVLPQPRRVRHEPAASDRLPAFIPRTCRRRSTRARPSPRPRHRITGRRRGDRRTPPPRSHWSTSARPGRWAA